MAGSKDYFGIDSKIVNILLAIFVGPILGIIVRFMEGKIVAGVVRIILIFTVIGSFIVWLVDLVKIITEGSIWRLLNS